MTARPPPDTAPGAALDEIEVALEALCNSLTLRPMTREDLASRRRVLAKAFEALEVLAARHNHITARAAEAAAEGEED